MEFLIDIQEKSGLRSLHFNSRWMQGAMRIAKPWDLELEYTRVMMASLLLRNVGDEADSFPRSILMIGLGAGSLTKFLYRHCPWAQLTVVEIDPRVVAVARQSFGLPDDLQRLQVVIADGFEYMHNREPIFDLILVDGFNERAHPGDLNTLPFYEACRTRLSGQGVLAVNLVGLSPGVKGGFADIETAFENRALMLPKCKSGNTIALAATGEVVNLSREELLHKSLEFEQRTGLALTPTFARLEHDLKL